MNGAIPHVLSLFMLIPICLIGAFVIFAIVLAISLVAKAGKRNPSRNEELNQEAEAVRQLYSALERMEKRIESLETILVDEFKRDKAANGVGAPGKAE